MSIIHYSSCLKNKKKRLTEWYSPVKFVDGIVLDTIFENYNVVDNFAGMRKSVGHSGADTRGQEEIIGPTPPNFKKKKKMN